MKVEVRFRALDASESLREHIIERVQFQLGRFGHELRTVVARIGDINGPRGGVDKRCQLSARGPRLGTVSVEVVTPDAWSAADAAIERLSRALGRELERSRTLRRAGPSLRRAS